MCCYFLPIFQTKKLRVRLSSPWLQGAITACLRQFVLTLGSLLRRKGAACHFALWRMRNQSFRGGKRGSKMDVDALMGRMWNFATDDSSKSIAPVRLNLQDNSLLDGSPGKDQLPPSLSPHVTGQFHLAIDDNLALWPFYPISPLWSPQTKEGCKSDGFVYVCCAMRNHWNRIA